jgi:DNA-binding transcriptional LysR family regulator
MALSLRQIRYFIATADAGQVSLAAANLSVSQSAVTAAIKALEGELETRLFERHSNGVTLTYEGHQFMQHAENIIAAVTEAMRALRRSGRDVEGNIRIGLSYTVAGYFLPQILARFTRVFPGITVKMQEIPRDQIEQGIVDDDLDIAVMLVSNLQNRNDIDSEVLIRSRRRLWLCADHPLIKKDSVSLAEIAQEPYVMLAVDEADRTAMRYWAPTPHHPNTIFETSSVEAVRSLVATGIGITILSDMVYRPWSLEGQRIEVRPVTDNVPTMDVGLAWRRGTNMSPPTSAFYEYLNLTFGGSGHGFVNTGP